MTHLFNCWRQAGYGTKTTVAAADAAEALDRFCQHHGFADHADYLRYQQRIDTDLVAEPIQ